MPRDNEARAMENLNAKLDLMINLLAFLVASDKSITEGARLLKMAGLDNRTIAGVLNTTVGTVSVVTANLRTRPERRRR